MFLIVGLGNPGKKYKKTRHNLGFRTIDFFGRNFDQFSDFKLKKKFLAQISQGKINSWKIILAKPQTFMNNSGKSVRAIIENYKINIENLMVVHDDLDLPLGKIRISKARGSGGHLGVQSIIDQLNSKNFIRFRIGICPGFKPVDSKKFVLEKFSKAEEKIVQKKITQTGQAIEFALLKGLEKAMHQYNQ